MTEADRRFIAIHDLKTHRDSLEKRLAHPCKYTRWDLLQELASVNTLINQIVGDHTFVPLIHDNNGYRIISPHDRLVLMQEMGSRLDTTLWSNNWEALFWHCDNIRHFYAVAGQKLPEWFIEKYGHRLNNNNMSTVIKS